MQHRAPAHVPGRHRRPDTLPGVPATPTTATPSTAVPARPEALTDAARAYLDLLASTDPLTPADLLPRTATAADGHGPAARRRDVPSHRAPAKPIAPALLGERGRYAVAAAAIAAGVGVAGVSAVTAAAPGRADAVAVQSRAASHTALQPSPPAPSATTDATAAQTYDGGETYGKWDRATTAEPFPGVAAPALGSVRTARKARPAPVAPQWVDPMPGAVTTSCFGQRWGRLHAGVDLAAPHGTPIRAAGAGVVVTAGEAAGYGNAVLIDHGNGYLTHYGHMATITVTAGDTLTAGAQIGTEGSTGHSTGPHLHFEVHEGTYKNPVEPTAWMHEHGVDIGGCGQD